MHSNNAWIFGHKAQHIYIHNMIDVGKTFVAKK